MALTFSLCLSPFERSIFVWQFLSNAKTSWAPKCTDWAMSNEHVLNYQSNRQYYYYYIDTPHAPQAQCLLFSKYNRTWQLINQSKDSFATHRHTHTHSFAHIFNYNRLNNLDCIQPEKLPITLNVIFRSCTDLRYAENKNKNIKKKRKEEGEENTKYVCANVCNWILTVATCTNR